MIDQRHRRDVLRLRRAQELADTAREREIELQLEIRDRALRLRSAPVELDAYRRSGKAFMRWSLPDDVC